MGLFSNQLCVRDDGNTRVIWLSCSLWAQSRENMEKFMFCSINANKIFSLSCVADVCCCISDCFIHRFNSTAAPALRKGGKQNNNKVSLKQTWWPSASWTFPKINEFFSWEADTENRCSQRNALFFPLLLHMCSHEIFLFSRDKCPVSSGNDVSVWSHTKEY